MMGLPGPAALTVDTADFPGDEEKRRLSPAGQAQILPKGEHALPSGNQLFPQFRPPGGMGEVPSSHQADALTAGPPVQVGKVTVPADGHGKTGMDVKIRNIHINTPLLCYKLRPLPGDSIIKSGKGLFFQGRTDSIPG